MEVQYAQQPQALATVTSMTSICDRLQPRTVGHRKCFLLKQFSLGIWSQKQGQ